MAKTSWPGPCGQNGGKNSVLAAILKISKFHKTNQKLTTVLCKIQA